MSEEPNMIQRFRSRVPAIIDALLPVIKTVVPNIIPDKKINIIEGININSFWEKCSQQIDVYNAPWTLANDDKLRKMLINRIISENLKLRILYLSGLESELIDVERKIGQERKSKMKEFITSLQQESISNSTHLTMQQRSTIMGELLEIKELSNKSIFSNTFFISERQNKKVAMLYIHNFLDINDRPNYAIEINDESVITSLTNEFNTAWEPRNSRIITVSDLLNH
jgi:hypothetical protein